MYKTRNIRKMPKRVGKHKTGIYKRILLCVLFLLGKKEAGELQMKYLFKRRKLSFNRILFESKHNYLLWFMCNFLNHRCWYP